MTVIVTESYEKSCQLVAQKIIEQVKSDPHSKLGLATGGTAENIYPYLVTAYENKEVSFANVTTVNLDEYIGMPSDNILSYRKSMDDWFFDKVDIDKKNTYVADGMNSITEEIKIFNEKLYKDKLIDFQLLGVGVSGHIGFNEPNVFLTSSVHTEQLDEVTIKSNARFFKSEKDVPKSSITMGVGDIMKASKIALVATGESKFEAMRQLLLNENIISSCPVTVLKMHRDCTIVIDKNLADNIGYKY